MRLLACLLLSLIASACSAAPVQFSWTAPSTNLDGSPAVISGYRVDYTCGGRVGGINVSSTQNTVTEDFAGGLSCSASMVAYNTAGDSPRSNVVQFTTPADAVPGAVTNLQIAWREHNRVTGSIVFNGTNAYAGVSSQLLTMPYAVFTWFKTDATINASSSFALVSQGNSTSLNSVQVFQFASDGSANPSVVQALAKASTGAWAGAEIANAFAKNTWHSAGANFASTTSRSVWLNGANKTTNTTSNSQTGLNRFTVGATRRSDLGALHDGKMAHMVAWSVALSDAEHEALAAGANPLTVQSANIVGYWPGTIINIASVDYLEDVSGNANHLTLFGGWSYDGADEPTVDDPPGGGTTINGAVESISLSTFTAQISTDRAVAGVREEITLATNAATVSSNRDIAAAIEAITLSTFDASLALQINAQAEQITLGTFLAAISSDRQIAANVESIALQTHGASISTGSVINAGAEQIALQTLPALVSLDFVLSAQRQAIVLMQLAAQITLSQNIDAQLESLTLTPYGATISLNNGIQAQMESLTLTTFNALLTLPTSPILAPGLEYTLGENRLHYTLPVNKLHFTFRS